MSLVLRSSWVSNGMPISLSSGVVPFASLAGLNCRVCSALGSPVHGELVTSLTLVPGCCCTEAVFAHCVLDLGVTSAILLGVRIPGKPHPFLVSQWDANFPY